VLIEDVESPPFPAAHVNCDGLYVALRALREWVLTYRDKHNALVGQEIIAPVLAMPSREVYTHQAVVSMSAHWKLMRRFRELWDEIVRNFENDWSNAVCVRQRVVVLQSAAILINNAFVPFEHREINGEREFEIMQQQMDAATQLLHQRSEDRNGGAPKEKEGR